MANVYGNKGNRWWVAYNTYQTNAIPGGDAPSGYESLPSGDAVDDAKFAAAAKATAKKAYPAGKGPAISVENVNWSNVNGPYTTQAEANAAISKLPTAPGAAQQTVGNPVGSAVNTLTGGALGSVTGFLASLENPNTWIRVGKVIVGVILVTVGVVKMTGIGGAAAEVAKHVPLPV